MDLKMFTSRDGPAFTALAQSIPASLLEKAAASRVNFNLCAHGGKLPIDTPERTIISAVAVALQDEFPKSASDIVFAAVERHDVADQVDQILSRFETSKSAAAPAPLAALTVKEASGETSLYYPLNGRSQIGESARALQEDYLNRAIPPRAMREASIATVKAAAAYPGLELPDLVVRSGEERRVSLDNALKIARMRVFQSGFDEYDAQILENGLKAASNQDELHEVLDSWALLDRAHNVRYDRVVDPYRAAYSGFTEEEVEKQASAHMCIGPRVVIPLEAFRTAMRAQDLEALFDDDALTTLKRASLAADAGDNIEATLAVDALDASTQKRLVEFILANAS